jgi:hypothetical protein
LSLGLQTQQREENVSGKGKNDKSLSKTRKGVRHVPVPRGQAWLAENGKQFAALAGAAHGEQEYAVARVKQRTGFGRDS